MKIRMNDRFRRLAAMLGILLACAGPATSQAAGAGPPAADFAKVVPGKTKDEVRAILGAPARTLPARGTQPESWEYPFRGNFERRSFWVEFGPDGTVARTEDARDSNAGPYRGP
jgi:hypothetical protein